MPLSEQAYYVAIAFKITERVEQQIIRFCVRLKHPSTKTVWMIQEAFGDDAMSTAQTQGWQKCFKNSQEFFESNTHSGRPATSREC